LISHPKKAKHLDEDIARPPGIPIWKLLIDPHIACASGALVVANISFAFLEPTISKWMNATMDASEWQQGMIWLPAFGPHLAGVIFTVKCAEKFPNQMWVIAGFGLALESLSCFLIPFCLNYFLLMIPISLICFGVALVDTSLLPMLGLIVDKKYVSVYGSVYAIADISYCTAYALGPIIAGKIVEVLGFATLNIFVGVLSFAYVPALYFLKDIHKMEVRNRTENVAEFATISYHSPTFDYQTFELNELSGHKNVDLGENRSSIMKGI